MKQVRLLSLVVTGFKSFAGTACLKLDQEVGLVLVSGDNQLEPRLGANGSGKSSIWDALTFCLYGTSVRGGARINDLVAHGEKQAAVTAYLEVDGREVQVSRSGPPARAHVDGVQVEQADIDRLVGLTRQRFLSSVVFGQAAPTFVDLPIPDRGALLDEVLDLQLWMRAADRAGKQHTAKQADLGKLRVEVGRAEGALSALEPIDEIQRQEEEWEAHRRARVAEVQRQEEEWESQRQVQIDELLADFEEREVELAALIGQPEPEVTRESVDALYQRYQELKAEETRLLTDRTREETSHMAVLEDIRFFKEHDTCPVCTQKISQGFSVRHVAVQEVESERYTALIKEIEAAVANARVAANNILAEWNALSARLLEEEAAAAVKRARIRALEMDMASEERMLERLGAEGNPHGAQRRQVEAEANPYTTRRLHVGEARAELEATLSRHRAGEEKLSTEMAQLDFWRQGFRRVRLFCINRVLRQLELETMNAAQDLGLVGWKISYATETETRSGTQKMGVQVEVQSPTLSGPFATWSGGEGQRVRLCTALGVAGLIQRWSGVRWGLEVYDEPTAFLSEEGIEDLLDHLKNRADSSGKSILLCDHRGLQHAAISRVIRVIKDEHGSRIE